MDVHHSNLLDVLTFLYVVQIGRADPCWKAVDEFYKLAPCPTLFIEFYMAHMWFLNY